ncbi:oligoendopeptidase F [Lagierella sp.]|uniref:oligoendopeptidase F n=1 Tax=Lagierella sp. TaxID=2849657 RepID=UPI002612C8ED|nr:oligoendopeptidase F [Lagierella sp.]
MDILKMVDRKDVDERYTWDLTHIFKSKEELQRQLSGVEQLVNKFLDEHNKLYSNKDDVKNALDLYSEILEKAYLCWAYTSLSMETDYGNQENYKLFMETDGILSDLMAKISFFKIRILTTNEDVLKDLEKDETYGAYIQRVLEDKPYVLSEETEKALAKMTPLNSFYSIYNAIKLQDMKFPDFEAGGKKMQLSYNLFEGQYEASNDTEIRRNSFVEFSKVLEEHKNSTAAAYLGECQKMKVLSELRGYDSVFDFLLHDQRVSRELYDRQLDVIMKELSPIMRKYARILKRNHNLDKMTYMDLKIDAITGFDRQISVEEAKDLIEEGLEVLGEEYVQMLDEAFEHRWIDFVNNHGKSTGAFCSSPYGTHSYVLINWTGTMTEAMTLAHELGHAGQGKYTNENCNILDTDLSMYLVEAPSTANELIMGRELLKKAQSEEEKKYLKGQIIARTYYHNFVTHFIEGYYQREVLKLIDQGKTFTADDLSEIFLETLKKFWGDDVEFTKGAELTWMRQPHYYMGLYPYTYSAGLTIGTQVAKLIEENPDNSKNWIEVLKTGGKLKPMDFAKKAGVDISTDKPLKDTIQYIGSLVEALE